MLTMNIEFILEFDCSFYARCSLCTSPKPCNASSKSPEVCSSEGFLVLPNLSSEKGEFYAYGSLCRNMAMQQKDLVDEQIYRVTRKGCY